MTTTLEPTGWKTCSIGVTSLMIRLGVPVLQLAHHVVATYVPGLCSEPRFWCSGFGLPSRTGNIRKTILLSVAVFWQRNSCNFVYLLVFGQHLQALYLSITHSQATSRMEIPF